MELGFEITADQLGPTRRRRITTDQLGLTRPTDVVGIDTVGTTTSTSKLKSHASALLSGPSKGVVSESQPQEFKHYS